VALPAIPTFDAHEARATDTKRRVALLACADGSTRKAAERWLSSAGFEVAAASGAAEALEHYGPHRPAIVLTDKGLRDTGGRSL
jgi:CheY-like chemotaxis protein